MIARHNEGRRGFCGLFVPGLVIRGRELRVGATLLLASRHTSIVLGDVRFRRSKGDQSIDLFQGINVEAANGFAVRRVSSPAATKRLEGIEMRGAISIR